MALNAAKYREALAHLGQDQPVFVAPPAAFGAWLADKRLPGDVVEFLLGTALAANVPFPSGCGGMWPPRDIMDLNDQESDILAGGLLAVGNACNGDFIVIDLRDDRRRAGFVGHDELARNYEGAKSWGDVREIFAPVADSLDEMLAAMSGALWAYFRGDASGGELYPCDYCEAVRPQGGSEGMSAYSPWEDDLPVEVRQLIEQFEVTTAEVRKACERQAAQVRERAQAEIREIEQRAEEAIRTSAQQLTREVKPLQEAYAKEGKLDEALAIRDRLRRLRTRLLEVRPDPGCLYVSPEDAGKEFLYEVVGSTTGPVWGTDVYTSDSSLAAAAVHAGVLQPQEKGIVRVTVVESPPANFAQSYRNGVWSGAWWGSYPAFRVSRA